MMANLQKTASILVSHLGPIIGLRLMDKEEAFPFMSYLYNLEPWADHCKLEKDSGVDRQIVKSPLNWNADHLKVGKRFVQLFSLMTTPEISRPCQFSGLMTLDCDSVLCTSWKPKSTAAARSEISQQEKFISFFKIGVLSRVMAGKNTAFLDGGSGAKAADMSVDDLSEVIRSLDQTAQGEACLWRGRLKSFRIGVFPSTPPATMSGFGVRDLREPGTVARRVLFLIPML